MKWMCLLVLQSILFFIRSKIQKYVRAFKVWSQFQTIKCVIDLCLIVSDTFYDVHHIFEFPIQKNTMNFRRY